MIYSVVQPFIMPVPSTLPRPKPQSIITVAESPREHQPNHSGYHQTSQLRVTKYSQRKQINEPLMKDATCQDDPVLHLVIKQQDLSHLSVNLNSIRKMMKGKSLIKLLVKKYNETQRRASPRLQCSGSPLKQDPQP